MVRARQRVVALLCAGWVAGRPPLRVRLSQVADDDPGTGRRVGGMRSRAVASERRSAVLGVGTRDELGGAAAGARGARGRPGDRRASLGNYGAAARDARTAARRNPLSLDPLWQLAFIADARGDKRAANQALERAARLQPANAEAWRRLGRYRLSVLEEPEKALDAFQVAYFLDPAALRSASDVLEASRALKAKG